MAKKKKAKGSKVKLEESTSKAFELDEIDKACKEIEEDERERKKSQTVRKNLSSSPPKEPKPQNMTVQNAHENNISEKKELEGPLKQKMISEEARQVWIRQTVKVVIEHLNKFGACVIDDFLGEAQGLKILNEVLNLRKFQEFQEGQLASVKAEKSIRSDQITWTDGSSQYTPNIRGLMNTVDKIVMTANKASNNGALGKYNITSRTKAMVACYPGEGTHYVKHIDNPSKDGRCITAIYYLNKDWDPEKDGGSLKIYSACVKDVIAQVDPIFDRVIFFWSDRRNPHEVLPAYRERYAITVWYMDEREKKEHDEKKKLKLTNSASTSAGNANQS